MELISRLVPGTREAEPVAAPYDVDLREIKGECPADQYRLYQQHARKAFNSGCLRRYCYYAYNLKCKKQKKMDFLLKG
eukprot:3613427-Rhodomonas_salina.2